MLHGGRARSLAPARENQLAVLRLRPFARDLARTGRRDGLTVARLVNRVRGWNGALRSPVEPTEQALDALAAAYPGAPIAVVGHSLGGRTAVYTAGHHAVRAVVGLAPWLEPGDPMTQLAGRRVLFPHGTHDRMTSAAASEQFADRAQRYAESVSFVGIRDGGHAMLSRDRGVAGPRVRLRHRCVLRPGVRAHRNRGHRA